MQTQCSHCAVRLNKLLHRSITNFDIICNDLLSITNPRTKVENIIHSKLKEVLMTLKRVYNVKRRSYIYIASKTLSACRISQVMFDLLRLHISFICGLSRQDNIDRKFYFVFHDFYF